MKAWQVHRFGEPEEMVLAEVPPPEPGPDEVRIRTHAAGLNFFDLLQVRGQYQFKPAFPFTPGAELAGVVDAVGEAVTDLAPGMRVTALPELGAFAGFALASASRAFPIPEGLGFDEAACLLVYHTSFFALTTRGKLRPGEWLLVHAGASGTGMAAIQIGKALGAHVIATAGSPAKLAFSLEQGADHALDYGAPAWVDRVKEITAGRGADVIYDPVGGDVFDLSTRCIAPGGRLLVVGFASGRIPSLPANRALLKQMSLVGVFWGQHVRQNPACLAETHAALAGMHAEWQIRPVVWKRYEPAELPAALRALDRRQVLGKAVLALGTGQ